MLTAQQVLEGIKAGKEYLIVDTKGKILCNELTGNIQSAFYNEAGFYGVYGDLVEPVHPNFGNQMDSRDYTDAQILRVLELISNNVPFFQEAPAMNDNDAWNKLERRYTPYTNNYITKELSEEAENVETFVGKNSGEERIRFIVRDSERILKPEEFEGAKLYITQKVNMKGEVVGETFSIERERQ